MTNQVALRLLARMDRLPPYGVNITGELKMAAHRRCEDIIDLSMGNPDGATPPHIVEKLVTVAQREDTHGYSTSKGIRSEEHTSELQSLMRISYAVFCLKKKKNK